MKKFILSVVLLLCYYSTATAQSYSREERMLWLSQAWKDVSNSFFDPVRLQNIGWDNLYVKYQSLVAEAENDEMYHKLMQSFLAEVQDGHTEFMPVGWISQKQKLGEFYWLPFTVDYIDNKYYITGWATDYFEGLELPCELIAVNRKPFDEYLGEYYTKYVSGSTEQGRRLKALSDFQTNYEKKSIDLTLKDINGIADSRAVSYSNEKFSAEKSKSLSSPIRSGYNTFRSTDKNGVDFFRFDIKSFSNLPITQILQSVTDEVSKSKYIVVDLRMNGGGNEMIADTLLMSFLDADTLRTYKSNYRVHHGVKAAQGYRNFVPEYADYYNNTAVEVAPEEIFIKTATALPTFSQPLYILIGTRTYSAAEDFLLPLLLHYPNRAVFIGTPTGGSTGAPLVRELPKGNYYRVCTRGAIATGDFNEKGIQPDVYYSAPIEDYVTGHDSLYDFTADYHKNNASKSKNKQINTRSITHNIP